MFNSRRQFVRTLTPEVIDPVVAVGCELELAQPAKKHLSRCRNVNCAHQPLIGYTQIVIARVAVRTLTKCGLPEFGSLANPHIRLLKKPNGQWGTQRLLACGTPKQVRE